MLLGIVYIILIMLSLVSFLGGANFISGEINLSVNSTVYANSTENTFGLEEITNTVSIDVFIGAISILAVAITIIIVLGTQIFGLGLNDIASSTVFKITMHSSLYGILSLLSSPMILNIPIVGIFIYVVITISFVLGVIKNVGGSTDEL